jgi:hypothetical protein
MTGWLEAWGEQVPETGDQAAMGHNSASEVPGMISTEQMNQLRGHGSTFDRSSYR